ncbi:hypothetical protein HPT25_16470 [Bacillus sp. BRMEA1]|uniref:hypothetical protein n=1 Tax=Neobacillus endophyticus TaxID=2738405 RepID=UPI00156311F8|nr:hypothetical protein [Neobacillus endophyticus]NRD78960.1 hypothetical protein [Neobacillus endophyticus]
MKKISAKLEWFITTRREDDFKVESNFEQLTEDELNFLKEQLIQYRKLKNKFNDIKVRINQ